jgi:branched-chain amino acid transport system permease protein
MTLAALRAGAGDARRAWRFPATLAGLALALAAAAPLVGLDTVSAAEKVQLAVAATALGFAVGIGGMPSLGQGAFMAVGGFASALLRVKAGVPAVAAVPLGAVAAALAGAVAGAGLVRLRPVFVAVSTWVLTWLVVIALAAFPRLSGGAQGLVLDDGLRALWHYELALALLAATALAFVALARAPFGIRLFAAAQRPAAAAALGTPAGRLRLTAFVGSAAIGGLTGALAVDLAGVADPSFFGPFLSFELLVAVLLGGARSFAGPSVGLAIYVLVTHAGHLLGSAEGVDTARYDPMIAAVLLLAALAVGGEGALVELRRRLGRGSAPPEARGVARPASPVPLRAAETVLQASGLEKRFESYTALAGLSLRLDAGRIVAVVGPNGSGKTTALRLLSGTLFPDAGHVRLGSDDVTGIDAHGRAERGIVRTLQATAVFLAATALENAIVGAAVREPDSGPGRALFATPRGRASAARIRRRALEALDRVGLAWAADVPAAELRAADQRALMIASALAARPRVLLVDEPSAGVGADELDRLIELLDGLRMDGLAVLLVEHNLRVVRGADHVIVLAAGSVVAEGEPEQVAADPLVRSAYLGGLTL